MLWFLISFVRTIDSACCDVVQCLERRALHPSHPLPDLSPIVEASLQVPPSVAVNSEHAFEHLRKQFKLEPVSKKEAVTGESVFNARSSFHIVKTLFNSI